MYDEISAIIATKFQVDPSDISPERSLADLELDSLDVVELSLAIEKELRIAVTDVELLEAGALADISAMIERRAVDAR
jgi:acyl carrier protein